jgi:glycosyltransferase involved in cell wall biosynthesis
MRILVVNDLAPPMVNGVVRAYEYMAPHVEAHDAQLVFLHGSAFVRIPIARDAEMKLPFVTPRGFAKRFAAIAPDAVHIATEGPLGFQARRYCRKRGIAFTTAFHTRLPDYMAARFPLPARWTWEYLGWFHNGGAGVMAPTRMLEEELSGRGMRNILRWPWGVDADLFRPRPGADLGVKQPVFLTVGRLAPEKNIAAFLALDLPGTKVVVGDGVLRTSLEKRFPGAVFLGALDGEALAKVYAAADVFVFPGRADTFGLVMLEALASGVPVAAFPAPAPQSVIGDERVGVLDEDLRAACLAALDIERARCRAFAETMTWKDSARTFVANVRAARARAEAAGRKASATGRDSRG